MKQDRGNVWLGAAAIVENEQGDWLVVKKAYSGLKGRWSLPAGFVQQAETIASAAIREVKEETGVDCLVAGLIGLRSGVIRNEISDNMAIFYCKPVLQNIDPIVQEGEILEAAWMSPEQLAVNELSSVMLAEMASQRVQSLIHKHKDIDPGPVFGYSEYQLFFGK